MGGYIIRRVVLIVPTLFLVTIIVFGVIRMIPGDVIDLMVAEMASESGLGAELDPDYIREMLGLDVPIHVQYGTWIANMFQGNLGDSLWTQRAVTEDLIGRIPISFELGFIALIIGTVVAIPIGIYSAIRQDTIGDYLGRSVAVAALSLPNFWVATMIIVFPSIWWNWSPPVKYIPFLEDPLANLAQFIIPAAQGEDSGGEACPEECAYAGGDADWHAPAGDDRRRGHPGADILSAGCGQSPGSGHQSAGLSGHLRGEPDPGNLHPVCQSSGRPDIWLSGPENSL